MSGIIFVAPFISVNYTAPKIYLWYRRQCIVTNIRSILNYVFWYRPWKFKYENQYWIYTTPIMSIARRVWRYQRGNQNPYIEEEQTTQWQKKKEQKDKQRYTKHTHKTKGRATWTPLKIGRELRYSGRVSSSCYTSGTRRVF